VEEENVVEDCPRLRMITQSRRVALPSEIEDDHSKSKGRIAVSISPRADARIVILQ